MPPTSNGSPSNQLSHLWIEPKHVYTGVGSTPEGEHSEFWVNVGLLLNTFGTVPDLCSPSRLKVLAAYIGF